MKRFIEVADRSQLTLLPESLDDYIDESNPVHAIAAFVAHLDPADLGFETAPADTGRPGYHPSSLLKLYICGYLKRVASSRCLEREAGRNLEVIWLIGRLRPDDKVIADFRKDNGKAIKKVCVQFVEPCRKMGLLAKASVAIDGSKFKAVNNRDRNFTDKTTVCGDCALKELCTTGKERRIARSENEHILEGVQERLDANPQAMRQRRETVEHPFGTIKARMGATHFQMRTLPKLATEMALAVLAYNLTRVMNIMGVKPLIAAMRV